MYVSGEKFVVFDDDEEDEKMRMSLNTTTPRYNHTPRATLTHTQSKNLGRVSLVFPSCVSGRGYGIGPVRVCMCLSVSTLMAEQFDMQTQNSVRALTLIMSRMRLKVKVKGQGRQVEKRDFRSFRWVNICTLCHNKRTSCDVTP